MQSMRRKAWYEMRTAILFGAYIIYEGLCNIARSNNYKIPADDRSTEFIAIVIVVCMIMDIIDFLRG